MEKLICPLCGKEVDYRIENKKILYTKDNVSFSYYENVAVCNECGEELYSDKLQKENQIVFEDALRDANQIITNEEIEKILKKYSITKRNLPLVLDLGEQTITRYLDGYIPTKKISDLLKKILNNPEVYLEYLEKNKLKLKENIYAKTHNKVTNILGFGAYDEKLEECAEYIIKNNFETSNLVLLKLLYFFDVLSRIFFNERIFKSSVKAWRYGPVYGQIYYKYKSFENNPIEIENNNLKFLNEDEKALLDEVIKCFGLYSGKVLTYFIHRDGPWSKYKSLEGKVIPSEELDEYAKKIKEEYNIKEMNDIHLFSEALFEKYKKEYNF